MKPSAIVYLFLTIFLSQVYAQDYQIYHKGRDGSKLYWVVAQDGSGNIELDKNGRSRGQAATFTIIIERGNKCSIKTRDEGYIALYNAGVKVRPNKQMFYFAGQENARLFRSGTLQFLSKGANNRLAFRNWGANDQDFVFALEPVASTYNGDIILKGDTLPAPKELIDAHTPPGSSAWKTGGGTYSIKPPKSTNKWVSHGGGGYGLYNANRDNIDAWEKIQITKASEPNIYYLKSEDGKHMSAQTGGAVWKSASRGASEKWQIFYDSSKQIWYVYSVAEKSWLFANPGWVFPNGDGILGTTKEKSKSAWAQWYFKKH